MRASWRHLASDSSAILQSPTVYDVATSALAANQRGLPVPGLAGEILRNRDRPMRRY